MERFGVYKFFVMLFLILILPNPEKKKKILEKKKLKQNKAKEFYCSKVKDKEKCGNE